MNNLANAKKNLEDCLYEYLYNEKPEASNLFNQIIRKFVVMCPVDFEIKDAQGNVLTYSKKGKVYTSDKVQINVLGEEKEILLYQEGDINIEFTATDDGYMDYVVEDYKDGQPIGHFNFYNVRLKQHKSRLRQRQRQSRQLRQL